MSERKYQIEYDDGAVESTYGVSIDDALRQANNAGDELEMVHDLQRGRIIRVQEVEE